MGMQERLNGAAEEMENNLCRIANALERIADVLERGTTYTIAKATILPSSNPLLGMYVCGYPGCGAELSHEEMLKHRHEANPTTKPE